MRVRNERIARIRQIDIGDPGVCRRNLMRAAKRRSGTGINPNRRPGAVQKRRNPDLDDFPEISSLGRNVSDKSHIHLSEMRENIQCAFWETTAGLHGGVDLKPKPSLDFEKMSLTFELRIETGLDPNQEPVLFHP